MDSFKQAVVSVGVPTFNRAAALQRSLSRIVGQTYRNLDIIVSDNASPNNDTEQLVRSFADARIRFFRQPNNLGACGNFGFVAQQALGNYFMWAADDDYLDSENFIETLCGAMQPNTVLVFPNVNEIFDSGGSHRFGCLSETYGNTADGFDMLIAWCKNALGYPFYGLYNLNNITIDRLASALDPRLSCFNEGMFLHWVFSTGQVRYVDSVAFNYVRHTENESLSISSEQRFRAFVTFAGQTITFYEQSDLELAKKAMVIEAVWTRYRGYLLDIAQTILELQMRTHNGGGIWSLKNRLRGAARFLIRGV